MATIQSFDRAADFLQATCLELEMNEAANTLVLGICGQVTRNPERFPVPPVFRTLEEDGSLVLAAIMTPPLRMIFGSGRRSPSEGGIREFAGALLGEGHNLPGVTGPVKVIENFSAEWEEATGTQHCVVTQLLLYELKSVAVEPPGRGSLRAAGMEDFELVTGWWTAARREMFAKSDPEEDRRMVNNRIGDGDVFLWDDDGPVSMASKTRPTRHGISVGMVYTPPEKRCRGYATACVGELSRSLLQSGWNFCALFADGLNPISNSIYRKIGYRLIGDMAEFDFLAK